MPRKRKKAPKTFKSEFCKRWREVCEVYPWLDKYAARLPPEKISLLEELMAQWPDLLEDVEEGKITFEEALRMFEEKKREIEEFLRRYSPPLEVRKILEDPMVHIHIKEEVMRDYLESLKKPPERKEVVRRKLPERPVAVEAYLIPTERDVYYSTEDEISLAKRLLQEQHGIKAEKIDFIIRSDREWQVIGIDVYGRPFCVTIKV